MTIPEILLFSKRGLPKKERQKERPTGGRDPQERRHDEIMRRRRGSPPFRPGEGHRGRRDK